MQSLAYLWKRNQAELLQDMIDSGLDAMLITSNLVGFFTDSVASVINPPHKHVSLKSYIKRAGNGVDRDTR